MRGHCKVHHFKLAGQLVVYRDSTAPLPRLSLPRHANFETCLRSILLHKAEETLPTVPTYTGVGSSYGGIAPDTPRKVR